MFGVKRAACGRAKAKGGKILSPNASPFLNINFSAQFLAFSLANFFTELLLPPKTATVEITKATGRVKISVYFASHA